MPRHLMLDAQAAMGFLVNQVSIIEPEVINIEYPDIQYPFLVPVETAGNEWAKSVTYFSMDRAGRADWFNHLADDVPLADVARSKHEQTIEMAAIGYMYTLEELGQAQMLRQNLTTERAEAARRAYEEFVDDIAMNGDTDKGITGLINNANVTVVDAAYTGTGSSPAWADKTAEQILTDVNNALTGIFTASNTVELADTILLPPSALVLISTKRIPDTTMTVLEWLLRHNIYTMQTNQPLTIRAVRGLETAGEGGVGRMVAYRRDPRVVRMHIPMPHQFLGPVTPNNIKFFVPGIFRLGGVEFRKPGAARYFDNIIDPAYE